MPLSLLEGSKLYMLSFKAKKEQEEKTKRELDALFQEAIKQPKVPQGRLYV